MYMNFLAYISNIYTSIISNNTGNTMVAVPLVLSIIGGVTMATSGNFDAILAETRDTRRSADAYQVSTALAMYYDVHDEYPIVEQEDADAWEQLRAALEPQYIQELPNDPSTEYVYDYESKDGQFAKVIYYSEVQQENKERWSY